MSKKARARFRSAPACASGHGVCGRWAWEVDAGGDRVFWRLGSYSDRVGGCCV